MSLGERPESLASSIVLCLALVGLAFAPISAISD